MTIEIAPRAGLRARNSVPSAPEFWWLAFREAVRRVRTTREGNAPRVKAFQLGNALIRLREPTLPRIVGVTRGEIGHQEFARPSRAEGPAFAPGVCSQKNKTTRRLLTLHEPAR